jgi:hypothetical protein
MCTNDMPPEKYYILCFAKIVLTYGGRDTLSSETNSQGQQTQLHFKIVQKGMQTKRSKMSTLRLDVIKMHSEENNKNSSNKEKMLISAAKTKFRGTC